VKVVLRTDVDQLGKKGDILDVSDGYARNYLVPRGLALKASRGAEEQAATMRRSRDVKDAREREAGEEIARQLVPQVIHLAARAGAGGKLFGSITAADITEAVQAQTGIELDRRKLALEEPVRELGTHRVMVKLHADVQFPITLEVAGS
jgi:large subunit ribosomal protein L9